MPKLFVCIGQLLVIPWLSAFSPAQVLCWHSCWFSDLQAPVAIVFLDKGFLRVFFFFVQFTWVYILLTFLFPYPLCSTSVSEGICLLTHLSGARGRCNTWLWWNIFITCRSVSSEAPTPEATVTPGCEYCRPLFVLGKGQLASLSNGGWKGLSMLLLWCRE